MRQDEGGQRALWYSKLSPHRLFYFPYLYLFPSSWPLLWCAWESGGDVQCPSGARYRHTEGKIGEKSPEKWDQLSASSLLSASPSHCCFPVILLRSVTGSLSWFCFFIVMSLNTCLVSAMVEYIAMVPFSIFVCIVFFPFSTFPLRLVHSSFNLGSWIVILHLNNNLRIVLIP